MSAFDLPKKEIFPLFTNTGIVDYVDNNWDMWIPGRDDMSDKDYDKLLTHIANASTDGRLEKMLDECFGTWIGGEFSDMLYSTLDEFVWMAVEESGIDVSEKED